MSTSIGSRAFTPFTYTQHIDTGSELYFPDEGLEASYRGLKFAKEGGYQLYYMICPEGKRLPAELSGRYSKISILQEQVDKWLDRNQLPAEATLPDVPPPPPPKKSHHKKNADGSYYREPSDTPSEEPVEAMAVDGSAEAQHRMSDSVRQLMEARDNSSQE